MLTSEHYASPVDWAEDQFAKPLGLPGLLSIRDMHCACIECVPMCIKISIHILRVMHVCICTYTYLHAYL